MDRPSQGILQTRVRPETDLRAGSYVDRERDTAIRSRVPRGRVGRATGCYAAQGSARATPVEERALLVIRPTG